MLVPLLAAAATAVGPTPAQISKAVQAAERSKDLWATINICDSRHHPNELGIRGEMPSLGFISQMFMTFQVLYRPTGGKAFKPVPKTMRRVNAGRESNKLRQSGEDYPFKPPVVLEGTVTFEWWHKGKLIGHTTRPTSRGHTADFADPRGYSAAVCTIKAG
jgi:hypothetical protein